MNHAQENYNCSKDQRGISPKGHWGQREGREGKGIIPNVIKMIFSTDTVSFLGMVLVMTFKYRLLLSHQARLG